jgi:nitrile hydratase
MGIDATSLTEFVVVENTEQVHNLIVCTLCSCYPRPILGRPPDWYKSFAYRSRAVVEPRAVMREFGTELAPDIEVRVFDSSADMRYLVLPRRPEHTEHLSEDELAALVTRDSMIGVTEAHKPAAAPALTG